MPFFDLSFWQDFLSNGLATLLGVIVGIPVALWISGYQERKIERERKEKILISLWEELRYDRLVLNEWKQRKDTSDLGEYLCSQLRTEAWRAFSDGGELEWVKDPILLNYLAQCYFCLRKVTFLSEKWLGDRLLPSYTGHYVVRKILLDRLRNSVDLALESLEETIAEVYKQIPKA